MWKLARDLKVGPLDCIWSALHTELNFVFVPLYMKILKYTASLVVKIPQGDKTRFEPKPREISHLEFACPPWETL